MSNRLMQADLAVLFARARLDEIALMIEVAMRREGASDGPAYSKITARELKRIYGLAKGTIPPKRTRQAIPNGRRKS